MSATNRGSVRRSADFYATPKWCTRALLRNLDMRQVQSFMEPCLGDGAIYNLVDTPVKHWCELQRGRDYLDPAWGKVSCDLIITNPPFSLALPFLAKSLRYAQTVCYLLSLNFLGAQKRYQWWKQHPPSHLIVLSQRPSFTGKGTDATDYAWFIWDKRIW